MKYPKWWSDTVTLYHRVITAENGRKVTRWQRYLFEGCFSGTVKNQTMNGTVVQINGQRFVRIPATELVPSIGDLVVIGNCEKEIKEGGSSVNHIKDLDNCFTCSVTKVNVHNGIPLPHYFLSEDWRDSN